MIMTRPWWPEALDQGGVALLALLLEVVQQAAALADHDHETAAAVVVLGVGLEVLGEVVDALGENRDLHLGRTRVRLVLFVVVDDDLFLFHIEGHGGSFSGDRPSPCCQRFVLPDIAFGEKSSVPYQGWVEPGEGQVPLSIESFTTYQIFAGKDGEKMMSRILLGTLWAAMARWAIPSHLPILANGGADRGTRTPTSCEH